MMTRMKEFAVLAMIAVMCAAATPASAISVELAKKCRALMLKAYPYELPGNRKGNSEAQREYFNKCVANEGNMPAEAKAAEPKAAIQRARAQAAVANQCRRRHRRRQMIEPCGR